MFSCHATLKKHRLERKHSNSIFVMKSLTQSSDITKEKF